MKLGLGTVQFGLNYGVSNTNGKTATSEVAHILEYASSVGFEVLDTAALYGESEKVLGLCLKGEKSFSIITKTPKFSSGNITRDDIMLLENTFIQSLEKLRVKSVYGLLLHNTDDLLKPNGALLWGKMTELKNRGLTAKIGISVYNGEQIEQALERFPVEIVQVPFNILDQRLLNDRLLQRVASAGVEVHSRSTFLQGLLMMPVDKIPPYFEPIYPLLKRYHEYIGTLGLSCLEAALAFVLAHPEIDKVIVGVTKVQELRQIVKAAEKSGIDIENFRQFSCSNERFINPSLWKA
jgi:aryl-alcohol dehydrogenase-like predicted oxidoreductase